jgi:hypothetical protein
MADGRPWPGYQLRFCPVCGAECGTHRTPVGDDRVEMVTYHDHEDETGRRCLMAYEQAAIKAVAFTKADTGISPRTTAARNLSSPDGTLTRACDDLLARLK